MYRSVPAHAGDPADVRLVLVDFGIARSLESQAKTTIATGTPHYMAPEQADGRADRRSDVYSAAVILYELLTRAVPYPGDSIGQIIRAQTAQAYKPAGQIRGDVTPALDAVIAKGLQLDPDQRYTDAGAWTAALAAAGGGDDEADDAAPAAVVAPVGATMSPAELRAARAAAASTPGAPPPGGPPSGPPPAGGMSEPPPRRRRRSQILVTFLALLALLGAAIAVIVSTSDDDRGRPPRHRGLRGADLVTRRRPVHRRSHPRRRDGEREGSPPGRAGRQDR